jgi:hypothetical protein
MLNELGSDLGFDFRRILKECRTLRDNNIPESIFLFMENLCLFQIDYQKKVFWTSCIILDDMEKDYKLSRYEIMETIDSIIKEEYAGENLEIMCWGEINSILIEQLYKEGNFK